MKTKREKQIYMIPLALWFIIIPIIVKVKFYANPLKGYSWYGNEETLADFFLYYRSLAVSIVGILMLALLIWQISKMKRKESLFGRETYIFIPVVIYLVLTLFSTLFSEYKHFAMHGMPDQFETVWNLVAYVIVCIYAYYAIVYLDSERTMTSIIFIGAIIVSAICVLQYFKVDIYRMIYAGDGYSFTFPEGTVYGPFYNTNYVGYYTLLFVPLFVLLCITLKDVKQKITSAVLVLALLVAMIGADSITAEIAFVAVIGFAIVFLLLKHVKEKKVLWIPLVALLIAVIGAGIVAIPRINAYVQASNTEKKNLENIFTNDDNVEFHYKGNVLYVTLIQDGDALSFTLKDQNQADVACEYADRDDYYYYKIMDERFQDISLVPAVITDDPLTYGFLADIEGKSWCFTNQLSEDGTYYYRTDMGTLAKLTPDTIAKDFKPLESMSSLANGRGYIWNKTMTILNDYILFGSGADSFALVFPNGDFVDRYNNGYDNLIITKPHNLYLQIAVQNGVFALICFLVFYVWYAISSIRIYAKASLKDPIAATGFAIFLGTIGYMISGIANDSTITIMPLFWGLLGMGIGINHKLHVQTKTNA